MAWIVYQENRYAPPIKAIEVDDSITSGQVESLVGSEWWVAVSASSAEDAISSAVAGGFKSDVYYYSDPLKGFAWKPQELTKLPGTEAVTIEQSLWMKELIKKGWK